MGNKVSSFPVLGHSADPLEAFQPSSERDICWRGPDPRHPDRTFPDGVGNGVGRGVRNGDDGVDHPAPPGNGAGSTAAAIGIGVSGASLLTATTVGAAFLPLVGLLWGAFEWIQSIAMPIPPVDENATGGVDALGNQTGGQ